MEDLMYLRKRMVLPEHSTKILRDWLRDHLGHPFPTKAEKQRLRDATGMTKKQLKYWFTNARRRIVPRLKEELGYTRPSASSAPDLSASTSSSNETLTDTPGESSHSRSATSGSSRHVSVDSGATSLSSGRRFHGGEPALSMRRDSISAPDLSSSGCSQLKAALLERTPSGHVIAEKQPKISAFQPALASIPRHSTDSPVDSRHAAVAAAAASPSYVQSATVSLASSRVQGRPQGNVAAIRPSTSQFMGVMEQQPLTVIASPGIQPTHVAAGPQQTIFFLPRTPVGSLPMAYLPATSFDAGIRPPTGNAITQQAQPRLVCLSPNQQLHMPVPISPSWQARPVLFQQDLAASTAYTPSLQPSPDTGTLTPGPSTPLVQLPSGILVRQDPSLLQSTKP